VETESVVGQYRADILAKRSGTDDKVVIENQFGWTDHDHLGKLLTYAAGVGADGGGAKTIVWIAERFTEPHRATLDWLNRCTEPGIRFFAVEIQLWKIGGSPFAPKFGVVSRPNEGQKQLTKQTAGLSPSELFYQQFWTAFIEFCGDETTLILPSPPSEHWISTYVGRGGFGVNLTASKRDRKLECQLWIEGRQEKSGYAALLTHKDDIIANLGNKTQFDEMPERKASKIFESSSGDVNSREAWPTIHKWLKERGEAYVAFFKPVLEQMRGH
jgi:hypothetical protein